MLLKLAYLVYMRTYCNVLTQKSKWINNELNHSEDCPYDNKIIMIPVTTKKN